MEENYLKVAAFSHKLQRMQYDLDTVLDELNISANLEAEFDALIDAIYEIADTQN